MDGVEPVAQLETVGGAAVASGVAAVDEDAAVVVADAGISRKEKERVSVMQVPSLSLAFFKLMDIRKG